MPIYKGSKKIKSVYLGTKNTNCLTSVPNNIKLSLSPLNVTVIGSPTIRNGVVSGFSTSNYLVLDNSYKSETNAEYVFKFTTGSSFSAQQTVVHAEYFINLEILTSRAVTFYSWSSKTTTTLFTASANTTYWVKILVNGKSKTYNYSTDGVTFTGDVTFTDSSINYNDYRYQFRLGLHSVYQSNPCLGSIDLPNCYAKINGELVWKGGTWALTLKAGSKVYVPNGKNADGSLKFDEVVVAIDRGNTRTGGGKEFLLSDKNGGVNFWGNLYSGMSAPTGTTYMVWYDTANNIIKYTIDGGATWQGQFSLPLAIYTQSSSGITSINQIFDWCGYIGSTAFVLPGVKGLIPNGFNEDGTYKVIEFTVPKVILGSRELTGNIPVWYRDNNTIGFSSGIYYDKSTNTIINTTGKYAQIGICNMSSGKITSLTPAKVQPVQTARKINYIFKGSQLIFGEKEFTFNVSDDIQSWVVPNGVKSLTVDCVASKGSDSEDGSLAGGAGGRVQCTLKVSPGQTLYFMVGAVPENASTVSYNASDIRIGGKEYANRVVVAGGGGSAAWRRGVGATGGAGGGTTGGTGTQDTTGGGANPGSGGTQSAGGAGGTVQVSGSVWGSSGGDGQLGLGGTSLNHSYAFAIGGVGGAGYYGGGGGAGFHTSGANRASGGGGGSSYTDSSLCSNVTHTQGYNSDTGYIKITLNFS